MASQDKTVVSRRTLSQISMTLPVLGKVVLFDGMSSARQIRAISRRLAEAPNDAHSRLCLAHLLATEGKNDEALVEWSQALLELPFDEDVQDNPVLSQKNAWSHYIFGMILFNKDVLEEAVEEWKKASALDKYGIGNLARNKLEEAAQNVL